MFSPGRTGNFLMHPRYATQNVKEALTDTPVVFVMGPRQVGKTTLVKSLINDEWEYITLDDQAQLAIAKADPVGFPSSRVGMHT